MITVIVSSLKELPYNSFEHKYETCIVLACRPWMLSNLVECLKELSGDRFVGVRSEHNALTQMCWVYLRYTKKVWILDFEDCAALEQYCAKNNYNIVPFGDSDCSIELSLVHA